MITTTMLTVLLALTATPQVSPQDEAAAWAALNAAVQSHTYPVRGRLVRQDPPDFTKQLAALDKALASGAGTSAEPLIQFYRGHALYALERFDEALKTFEDIRTRFPNHGLNKCSSHIDPDRGETLLGRAIDDCKSEIAIRKTYTVRQLPNAVPAEGVRVVFHTSQGDFEMQVYDTAAPKTVANFKKLIKSGFYNDTYVHMVNTMQRIQLGCPNTHKSNRPRQDDGFGSPGYDLPVELNSAVHLPGACSMVRVPGKNRAHGSQFMICINQQAQLNNVQAVFARVTKGLDVVKRISQQRADDDNNPYEQVAIRGVEWIEE